MLLVKIDKDGKPIGLEDSDELADDLVPSWDSSKIWYNPVYKNGEWVETGEPPTSQEESQPNETEQVKKELEDVKSKLETSEGALLELMETVYKRIERSNANDGHVNSN